MSTVEVIVRLDEYGLARRVLAPATSVGVGDLSAIPVLDEHVAIDVARQSAFATQAQRASVVPIGARRDPVRNEWVVTFDRAA